MSCLETCASCKWCLHHCLEDPCCSQNWELPCWHPQCFTWPFHLFSQMLQPSLPSVSLFSLHCSSLFLCQWQYFSIIHIALRLEFFPFFLIHSFVACSSPSSATFAYTLLLMHDLAGHKSHFSADTLNQIYPWVADNFNCYQQEAGCIPIQTPLSWNEWSFVTYWKIKVA